MNPAPPPAPSKPSSDKVPLHEKILYGMGSGSFQLSTDGVKTLANPVFNITLGLSPSLIGLVLMIARLVDSLTDPLMGKISDDTRSRWGRRRPYIFVGSFLTAGAFILLWTVPRAWTGQTTALFAFLLVALLVFYACATVQVIPYHTLGMEMTPDYHERTSVAAYKMVFSFLFAMLLPWIFRLAQADSFGGDTMAGIRYWSYILAGVIIAGGVLPALFVKERYYKIASKQGKTAFGQGLKLIFQNKPFLMLTALLLTSGLGLGMVHALGPYIVYYHIYGGDVKKGQELVAIGSNCFSVAGLLLIPLVTWTAKRVGKVTLLRWLLVFHIAVYLSSFLLYSKTYPWLVILYYVLAAPYAAGFWTLTTSMKADVCDDDELQNGLRREGMFASVGAWLLKIALSTTFLFSGLILDLTGFRAGLGGDQNPASLLAMRVCFAVIPVLSLGTALFFLAKYPLHSRRMAEIREELEARRAAV